jgi:hypothetical protein
MLALLVPSVVVIILAVYYRAGRQEQLQAPVATYLQYWRSSLAQLVTVEQYTQASRPQNFTSWMSRASFGGNGYFQTTHRDDRLAAAARPVPTSASPTPFTNVDRTQGLKPLPDPPSDVWCVKLSSPDLAVPKVVLVALHEDTWNAYWILHEVADPETVLASIGCGFSAQ